MFLTKFNDVVHGNATALVVHDLNGQANIATGVELDPAWQRLYAEYYATHNPWMLRGKHFLRTGTVKTGPMSISDEELVRTEFY